MIKKVILLFVAFVSLIWNIEAQNNQKPCVAFSFDDGNPEDVMQYKVEDWNAMIVDQLAKYNIQSVWFVAAKKMDNEKGKVLMQKWNDAGNIIANHTYNHLNYNDTSISCVDFINEIQACDSLISGYSNYRKIFRFPYLKGGNTVEKRDSLRFWFSENGFQQGWVTIDGSDWYINVRMLERLEKEPQTDINAYRDFYVNHIFERAQYYNNLSTEINQRQIKHTVLLHFNLTSALFLTDLIEKFKQEGWEIDSYSNAIKDPVYLTLPSAMPAEQSLIWLLARQSEHYDLLLRYPGEDGDYEKDKMDKLGL
ncbi:MAG: polysaccharide deacetylase family protein [Bacteroidales bacterium]|nr:polysaccharide deacetylase family protein [Bacteroidales bacterium]